MKIWLLVSVPLFIASFGVCAAPKLTIYDDGRSCPANCDSHVVMHRSLNGTVFAHKPDSTPDTSVPCAINSACEICFDDEAKECLVTQYRGSGPGKNTFDLTPAFYEEWCPKDGTPGALKEKCTQLKRTARKLDGRVNCIKNPRNELCVQLMERSTKAKDRDIPLYEKCKQIGQHTYNRGRPAAEKREHGCAYEFESNGGPNSRGLTWKRLLPGACREGTFVGRDGLDCCSGNEFVDAALGIECRVFYPRQQ